MSNAVKYERRPFEVNIHNNPFAGDPRPELDQAWHELFEDIRIRVTSHDLSFYNVTSLPLADGSGYISELGVHHELHCLVSLVLPTLLLFVAPSRNDTGNVEKDPPLDLS